MSNDPYNAIVTAVEPAAAREGPLAGKTLLVKDLIDTAGIRTTYGSRLYAEHVPDRNATVVDRAVRAGAVVVGKANLPEFAWSVLGQNEWFGTVHNPAQPGKTTGGSSSGNAAALAAGLVELGIGSDTGCSIRLPSAACGIVGLKSRWGVIPTDGVFPLCPTLDTVGPMARSVADVALFWSVLAERAGPGAAARRAHGRAAPAAAGDRRRPPDRDERPRRGVRSPTSSGSAPASSRPGSRTRPRTPGRSSSTRRRSRTRPPSRAAPTSTAT